MTITWQTTKPSWEPLVEAPQDAPSIVLVVLDDTGFAHLGCFGSDIQTPNIDRLASNGLRYTNFHTTALCSPTRACILTGRNHHSVGMRFLTNVDTGFSNCRGEISPTAATLAEILSSNGYSTFALGKWHLANMEDCSPAGPFSNWPLGRGFDRFHGFLGGATDQFSPELVIDNRQANPPSDPDYHISEDIVDQAIAMISAQHSADPRRPFFAYLAFGATHSPHQAPAPYIEKYRGAYNDGWDEVRKRWFNRQLELGIVPEGTQLAPRNPGVEAWSNLSSDAKKLYARFQEVFAGFLDHTDVQIGRLVDFLETQNLLENTLIVVLSDNGASQEGHEHGTLNELAYYNKMPMSVNEMVNRIDEIGGPNLHVNYPRGWAQVGNTPLRYYKAYTYEGGIRDPLIVHWPDGVTDAGTIRNQYHHAIDILPTVLDSIGLDPPTVFKGVAQQPIEGASFRYTFSKRSANAPTNHPTQYYEMMGHRGIWHNGWKAVTLHAPGSGYEDEVWSLFDTENDFSEVNDVSAEHPERLQDLIDLWWIEAERYNVLPLDDRNAELFVMRRPRSQPPSRHHRFLLDAGHVDRFNLPDFRNRSFQVIASIKKEEGDEGVLVAVGARTGGFSFWIADGFLNFAYNFINQKITLLKSNRTVPLGELNVAFSYSKLRDNEGVIRLWIEKNQVGQIDIKMLPWRQTIYGMDIGSDQGSTVVADYSSPFYFTGLIHHVDFHLKDDQDDQVVSNKIEFQNSISEQ